MKTTTKVVEKKENHIKTIYGCLLVFFGPCTRLDEEK